MSSVALGHKVGVPPKAKSKHHREKNEGCDEAAMVACPAGKASPLPFQM